MPFFLGYGALYTGLPLREYLSLDKEFQNALSVTSLDGYTSVALSLWRLEGST